MGRQKEFEKYKKKQERNLIQKTQELEKVIADLKLEFVEKEKRHKSKLERLKKQNKKLKMEKDEMEKEMKKFEEERLEFWKTKSDVNPNAAAAAVAIKKQNPMMIKKKKKYSIS